MYRHVFMVFCGMVGVIVLFVQNYTQIKSFILQDISGHWAEPNIQYLVDEGILMGYPDRTFQPDAPLTRAEAAMIVSQIQESKQRASSTEISVIDNYRDQEEIPGWARKAIAEVTETSIMKGYTDDTFRPNHYVSRHEAFQIIREFTHNPSMNDDPDPKNVYPYITRAEFCSFILQS